MIFPFSSTIKSLFFEEVVVIPPLDTCSLDSTLIELSRDCPLDTPLDDPRDFPLDDGKELLGDTGGLLSLFALAASHLLT